MDRSTGTQFDAIVSAIQDNRIHLTEQIIRGLSDTNPEEDRLIRSAWIDIPEGRKCSVMDMIAAMDRDDFTLNFESMCKIAVNDPIVSVRRKALQILAEIASDENADIFIQMLTGDPDDTIRGIAARALGTYVYNGEVGKLSARIFDKVKTALLRVVNSSEMPDVRQGALEAIAYSSGKEVTRLIKEAFASDAEAWLKSAIIAMGNSADDCWNNEIVSMLDDDRPDVQTEAIHTAGELQLTDATFKLIEILEGELTEPSLAAIWALSQIGGSDAVEALEKLKHETIGTPVEGYVSEAIENLEFNEGLNEFHLFDFPESYTRARSIDDPDDAEEFSD